MTAATTKTEVSEADFQNRPDWLAIEASLEADENPPNLKMAERPDWTLFRTVEGLAQKAGVPTGRLRRLALKELADNALDCRWSTPFPSIWSSPVHFATPVNITGIVTLFDPNHADFGSGFNAATVGSQHFLFCATNNSSCTPSTSETFSSVNTVSMFTSGLFTDFEFAESSNNVEFYVSALTYNTVPGPIVGAGLPGLTLAAGGLLALARRRRQLVV
jgi:hypothetical protein